MPGERPGAMPRNPGVCFFEIALQLSMSTSSALLSLFLGEGSPTKIDYRKKGTRILTSLLEDLVVVSDFLILDSPPSK